MSYILDALRRADAERERGAVPGLSSQQHAYVEDDAAKPQRSRVLVWAVVALAAALVVAVAWNFVGGAGPSAPPRPVIEGSVSPAPPAAPVLLPTTPAPAVEAPPPSTAPPPSPAATAKAAPAPQGSVEPAPAGPAAPVHPPRAAAKHAPEPKRVARRNVEPETAPAPANTAAANSATAKAAEPKAAEAKAARAPSEGRVYQQAELPDDVRRDLPKLVIGGASYSGDPASRMVIINGQIFHEGDQLAPQLVLERIKLKSAVLSYKGYRYELTF